MIIASFVVGLIIGLVLMEFASSVERKETTYRLNELLRMAKDELDDAESRIEELHGEPKFKVGDEIKTGNTIETIAEVGHATLSYYCESGRTISFENQDLWHLAPKPHYDISNFKAFDKVLVRDTKYGKWNATLFSYYIGDIDARIVARFRCINSTWIQCIPFEGNEPLLGTTDMCDEQYINW